ncbi:MAG: bis(5'-nucleosyl)-tetraphosphatase (symmetrical) YqeK [Clostridia bacterium]|nr:bis(5'-nucleosyl)-tetraphosphatase (symmetrical) YqeK [Clostridia bacterium]
MENLNEEEIIAYLKGRLKEGRFLHSLNVMKMAIKLAEMYHVDIYNAKFAGLLHDCAKNMQNEELIAYCDEHQIPIDDIKRSSPGILHADVGADIAKNVFGANPEIEEAIRYHTLANREMTDLDKIIYIADLIEEGRTLPGLEEIREIVYRDLNEGYLAALKYCIENVAERGKAIHQQSLDALETAANILKE